MAPVATLRANQASLPPTVPPPLRRFVLVTDSSVPLYDPLTFYQQVGQRQFFSLFQHPTGHSGVIVAALLFRVKHCMAAVLHPHLHPCPAALPTGDA